MTNVVSLEEYRFKKRQSEIARAPNVVPLMPAAMAWNLMMFEIAVRAFSPLPPENTDPWGKGRET